MRRIVLSRRTRKTMAWTVGMAFVGLLLGAKSITDDFMLRAALYGAAIGFVLGAIFSWRLRG
jgi:hypothetical protein